MATNLQSMGVRRNFSRGGQRQHFANLSQVDDDAIKNYVRETLYPYYTTTPQRNCPMLQQRSQKCTLLAAVTRYIPIIFTIGYLHQWRTQKIFMGGVWFKVIWWLFVFGFRCLWRHNLTSFPFFQTNVLAKFVEIVCIFFYIHSHYICRCTEYELSALQVRLSGKNKLNATTQQFITAKITGCALKQGNETHSSLRQSNLQLQNQAALRSL